MIRIKRERKHSTKIEIEDIETIFFEQPSNHIENQHDVDWHGGFFLFGADLFAIYW